MTTETMLLINALDDDNELTFALIPISDACPYVEARFNIQHKLLHIISKSKFMGYKQLPKLDANGKKVAIVEKKKVVGFKEELKMMEVNYDHYLYGPDDIIKFVAVMTAGPVPNLEKYFQVADQKSPTDPGSGQSPEPTPIEPTLEIVK